MRDVGASVWVLALTYGLGLGGFGCGSNAGGSHGDAAQLLDLPTSSGGAGGVGGTGGRADGGSGTGGGGTGGSGTRVVGSGGTGGSGTGGGGGADASVRDSFDDVAEDVPIDGTRDGGDLGGGAGDTVWDGPPPGGPLCGVETDNGVLTPSTLCTVAPLDAIPVCQGAGPCPFGTTAYKLTCGGYGPWLVPAGTDGASIMFSDASGPTHLFSLAPGGAKVEDVPALTSASNALAVDPTTGNRTIFAGEMPGIWRVRETAAGWRRESVVEGNGPDLTLVSAKVLVSAARVLDADRAIVAYFALSDYQPRLAVREAGCWRTTPLSAGQTPTHFSLDLDATNRPWTTWYERDTSGMMIRMAGPDGTTYLAWKSASYSALGWADPPILLAGGLAGTAAYPAIVTQRDDGVHVLVPDASAGSWTDRILDGTAIAQTPGCLTPISVAPATGCDTTVSCTTQTAGSIRGFSAARVASGNTYVAWVAIEGQTTFGYRLDNSGLCETPTHPAKCGCIVTTKEISNTISLVLTRADTGAEAMRFTLDSGGVAGYASLGLAVRGDTLLLAVSPPNAATGEYRYLEIDTTRLPK